MSGLTEDSSGKLLANISLQATGKNENWATVSTKDIPLKKGENKIRVIFENEGVNLNYFEIK
ncbi:carbohydrate-binding protein [Chryseobacterium jejuense]|uniref:carbohydrate-binding protein n=1 Tax=Chryseobacterium jejuense TaxID=445960 RepID=UPI000B7C9CE0|nr:carbohydrate-binding protein [Chryseobacterium jejuense]